MESWRRKRAEGEEEKEEQEDDKVEEGKTGEEGKDGEKGKAIAPGAVQIVARFKMQRKQRRVLFLILLIDRI